MEQQNLVVVHISDDDEPKQEEKLEQNPSKSQRNALFLRIGKQMVLPVNMTIHDPKKFNDLIFQVQFFFAEDFQELLAVLKEILPFHLGMFEDEGDLWSLKDLDSSSPEIFKGSL
jgi:hypothetical protein